MRIEDAEDLWLACVCQSPRYADHSRVTEEHLSPRGRSILDAIRRVVAEGYPVVHPSQLERCGDLRTIERRVDQVDAESTIELAEKHLLRAWSDAEYAKALQEASKMVAAEGRVAAETHLERRIQAIDASGQALHWDTPYDVAQAMLGEKSAQLRNPDLDPPAVSGFAEIDRLVRSWPRRRMTVIGGFTNHGKSTLTLQILVGLARRGMSVAMIGLEDEPEIPVQRMLRFLGRSPQAVDSLVSAPKERAIAEITRESERVLKALPMRLSYIPGADASQVAHAITDASRRWGARVIAVDYLQTVRTRKDRRVELGEAAGLWKAAAAKVGSHLILVSQLHRPHGENPVPNARMFKESGDIENAAEYALLIHRPNKGSGDHKDFEPAQIICDKAKDGPTGALDVDFDLRRHVFEPVR